MLKITEMYSVRNNSNPQLTQLSPNNFQIDVPADSALESFQAKRAGAVWVNVQAVPAAAKGSYRSDFPLRPGDTLFKFVYRIPQIEGGNLHVNLPYPTSRFAVLHSPELSFQAAAGAYTNPGRVQGMKLEQAMSKRLLAEAPTFVVSVAEQPAAAPNVASSRAANESAGGKAASPARTAILLLVLIPCAFFWAVVIYAARRLRETRSSRDLEKLKQQLLRLESSRLSGAISTEQYAVTKRQIQDRIQSSSGKQKVGSAPLFAETRSRWQR
jgi:hypothetical protein